MGSREKVLKAAAEMIGEDVASKLSVRAVAARAGVSTGSLRFHFPSQRELQEAVLARVYEHFIPDDPIRDTSIPARERLVNCLRQVLAPAGIGAEARKGWTIVHEAFIAPEPTEEIRTAYIAHEQQAVRRVEYWLSVLADEGALPKRDHASEVRFLLAVLNGLSVERALPGSESVLRTEPETLYIAVDCILGR